MRKLNPFRFLGRGTRAANSSVRSALAFSTAQQYTNLLITFPSIMILSRLLTPREVGVYSVALTFTNAVHMLRDMGTSEYLVQVPELDNATARSAFTINLIIAWFLAFVLFFGSPLLAEFFKEDGVGKVLRILTITFLLLPIGATVNAVLVRNMLFAIRYKIAIVNLLAQNSVTIVLAWYGFGYYSPAWGAVAGMTANIAGCFFWASEYRIRGVGLAHWREVTQFGVQKSAGTILNQVGRAAPDFVIGRMLGMAQVGLFSRGFGLARMFKENLGSAIGPVSYSAFAQSYRNGEDVGALYLRTITYITGVGWPLLGFASIMAYPLIHIFFGKQWDAAVPILRLMSIHIIVSLVVLQYQDLLTAVGRVGLASLWTAIWQAMIVIMLVISCNFGLVAVAAGFPPSTSLLAIAVIVALTRFTNITITGYLRALAPSLGITVCALAPTALSYLLYPPGPEALWVPTIVGGLCWLVGAIVGGLVIDHPIRREISSAVRKKFGRSQDTATSTSG